MARHAPSHGCSPLYHAELPEAAIGWESRGSTLKHGEGVSNKSSDDMTQTAIQKAFSGPKRFLPTWLSNPIRNVATAVLTPILYSYRTGHLRSSFKMAAVSKYGEPLPWYTYPSIDFLKYRDYTNKTILEFGGGQSTLWWAKRAKEVVVLEGNHDWYHKIRAKVPANVRMHYVSMQDASVNVAEVKAALERERISVYDVIVIDGLYRFEMIDIALGLMANDGMIICDNAEGYGFYAGFKQSDLNRVDFYGNAAGVVLSSTTSIYFKTSCFAFHPTIPIHDMATEE